MATGWRSRIDDLQFPLNDGGGASSAYSSVALQPTAGDESGSAAAAAGKPERSRSLDAFRGAVIVLMIFVDDAGGTYGGHIDHSPWDVIHLADFVMPLFLFIVGVAMVMAQRSQNKPGTRLSLFATNAWRCTKLFLIGLYVQGGKNLTMLRVPGILQRIAFAQIVTAAIEIGVPERDTRDSVGFEDQSYWRLYKRHAYRWLACMAVVMLYCGLLYGTNTGLPGCSTGETTPACNAAYYWDNELLGVNHMYRSPTYRRLPACDPCGNATRTTQPLPVDCPAWCVRPFDPEGSLASFAAVFSLYVGAFVGHIWLATPGEDFAAERVRQAAPLGAALVVLGFLLQFAGIPMNKNLFSLSYIFFMAGAATLFLLLFWYLIDVRKIETPFLPFIWNGLNAIFIFVAGACDLVEKFVNQWYVDTNDRTLTWWIQDGLNNYLGIDGGVMTYTVIKIVFFTIVAWLLARNKIFFKV